MTILTYLLAVYLMTCVAVYAVVRATISDASLRAAFLLIGCFAPFLVVYVMASMIFSKEIISSKEKEEISKTAELIEKERRERFGHVVLPSHRRLKIEYVRALNRAAGTIERVVELTA